MWVFCLFSSVGKKVCFFCGFCIFGKCKLKKVGTSGEEELASIELVDDMGGVMSERKFGGKENARAHVSEC